MIGELRPEKTEAQGKIAAAEKGCIDLKKELHDTFGDTFIEKSSRQTFAEVVRSSQKAVSERTSVTLIALLGTTEATLAPSRGAVDDLLGSRDAQAKNLASKTGGSASKTWGRAGSTGSRVGSTGVEPVRLTVEPVKLAVTVVVVKVKESGNIFN
jgi:hypothetical protein